MDIRILKYFLAVAQEENITKAAESVHTTQPNLSRQMAELEKEVGKDLFIRGSRKITLTEEGTFLRRRAQEIVGLLERTESDLSLYSETVSGDIYIGAAETYIMRRIGDVMVEMRKNYPQVQFHIFSGSTQEVTEGLDKGIFDFGLLVEPIDFQKYDYYRLPMKEQFGLLMRPDCPLAARDCVKPEDIKDQPVIVSEQQIKGNVLSGWLGYDASRLNIVSTFNLITTPAMFVEAGLGSAFTFDNLVNTTGRELCFRPLSPKVEATLSLVWKKYPMFTSAAKVFLGDIQNKII